MLPKASRPKTGQIGLAFPWQKSPNSITLISEVKDINFSSPKPLSIKVVKIYII
jgi:hypothetical protein